MNNERTDLIRAMDAIARSQERWLRDLAAVCQGDPRFLDAFRRWREWLTLLKVQLLRAEQRLLHYLLVPEKLRPWRDCPHTGASHHDSYQHWQKRIPPYLDALHLDTRYMRISDPRDLDLEPSVALASTDLVAIASIAEHTQQALRSHPLQGDEPWLEDLAFYQVLAPWKVHGFTPLADALRWLDCFLSEMEEL
ncbi:MAG: hypothetical protein EA401_07410 [Planctomycetota bacterium]|nr:MAG: hypothetical protein EA401_07410 [Planctomycetota bacterium]